MCKLWGGSVGVESVQRVWKECKHLSAKEFGFLFYWSIEHFRSNSPALMQGF